MIDYVFYGNRFVMITNETSGNSNNLRTLSLEIFSRYEYKQAIKKMKDGQFDQIVINTDKIDSIIEEIKNEYHVIEAAGGIVTNKNNETLMISRRGKWDLPKGKIEPGESIETAAEREIEEETGVSNLKLHKKLKNSYHVYEEKGKEIFKITHWFHYSIDHTPALKPQTEEDISEIRWFSRNDMVIPLSNTYESIKNLMISSGV